ncbi:MAG: hypothetical protein ACRDU0_03450, partial [Mycobacterium sp.]
YTPDQAWAWNTARGWLEVFPGATTVLGGLLLVVSGNRATAMFGGWLAAFAGAWFVVGRAFASTLGIGDIGQPVAATDVKRAVLEVCYFSGLGALIVFLGGAVLARLSVRMARDVELEPVPEMSPAADMSGPFSTPTPAVSPDAMTQERVGQPGLESHRREGKARFFRRRRASANQ